MSNIVLYDPSDVNVANRVTAYKLSVNQGDHPTSDKLVNPDVSALSSVPLKYWKESSGLVVEMSQAEKDTCDAAAPGPTDRIGILALIMSTAESETQFPRMLAAIDKYPSFTMMLDANNYALARQRMAEALSTEDIIQADYDLIDSIIPT